MPANETVCAVVATFNRKDLLRNTLASLAAQTRPLDCILVVDNCSTDGTQELLRTEYSHLELLFLTENTGGAGGFAAGMKWATEHGYDWMWVMDDDVEALPDGLATLLSYSDRGDVVVGRKMQFNGPLIWQALWDTTSGSLVTYRDDVSFEGGRDWFPVQYCNFEGALIRRQVVETVGLPDQRYFIAGDDTLFGYKASLRFSVIYVHPMVMQKKVVYSTVPGKLALYLTIRNRFLNYEHLVTSGLRVDRKRFLLLVFWDCLVNLRWAFSTPPNVRWTNMRAVIDGFRDGLNGRFGPPPWLRK